MISPLDPFALTFDSIKLDRNAPTPHIETPAPLSFDVNAFDANAPAIAPLLFEAEAVPEQAAPQAPGFYLLDDANGRFTIDRDTGIVTLVHDHLMALEAGAIHPVHIKVIEHSGATYELRFRLRMTGRIPQIAGAEENDALATLAAMPLLDLMDPIERAAGPTINTSPWATFSMVRAHNGLLQRLGSEREAYGALLEAPPLLGYFAEPGYLMLDETLPAPSAATALWKI